MRPQPYTMTPTYIIKFHKKMLFSHPICVIIDWVIKMDKEKELPKRKDIRLKHYDYSSPGGYFLTICASKRCNYFWKNVGTTIGRPQDVSLTFYGNIVDEAINNIPSIYPALEVDSYVIMPDHIHLLLVVHADEYGRPMVAPTMSRVVQHLKGYVSKRIGCSIWQKRFVDHVIRNHEDYEEHIKYICENPIKWSLKYMNNEEYVDVCNTKHNLPIITPNTEIKKENSR